MYSISFDIDWASDEVIEYSIKPILDSGLKATIFATHKSNFLKKLYEKYPNDARVKRLKEGFNPKKVQETLPTSELTAYSENKGEKLAFCLSKTKHSETIIDESTLMFVYFHELAHVMSVSVGHKKEFWDNFKFILTEAKKMNMYNPVDYKKKNQPYCGMSISDNPYYDI